MSDPNTIAFLLAAVVGLLASVRAEWPIMRFALGFAATYAVVIAIAYLVASSIR